MAQPAKDLDTLYSEHIAAMQQRFAALLDACDFDALLIASGNPVASFMDDIDYPFRTNPYFKHWIPLCDCPGSFLLIETGVPQPKLLFYQAEDFWHNQPALPTAGWVEQVTVRAFSEPAEIRDELPKRAGRLAFIGQATDLPMQVAAENINPPPLLNGIDYHRAFKTAYEQACLRQANCIAIQGHRAAEQAYLAGGSEYEINQAYLVATAQRDTNLPYANIIALNEHASVLHYTGQDKTTPGSSQPSAFLIDAGAQFQGYIADISRTYTRDDTNFRELILALDNCQLEIVDQARPGVDYLELHLQAHRKIAEILVQFNLVNCTAESCFDAGITRTFFPHGLGHFIGVQVHERGGHLVDARGTERKPPENHPFLRLTRTIKADQAFTIEPGLYFIPLLLDQLRGNKSGREINWTEVERLIPYGGIRIEDDILVHITHTENLTRDAFIGAR